MDLKYVLLILLGLGVALGILAINIGLQSGSKVSYSSFQSFDCPTRLQILSSDYGAYAEKERFFLSNREIEFVDFNNNWLVPISTDNCRIIENNSKVYFQTLYLKRNLVDVPVNYFASTRDCVNIAAAKGDKEICGKVSVVNNFVGATTVNVIATLPTNSIEDTMYSLTKSGVFTKAVGAGVNTIKMASGQEIGTVLQLTENTTCDSVNAPKLGIWGLADNANAILMKAKNNNEFEANTIPTLFGSTQLIISLWNVKTERQLKEASLSKNPGLFEIVGFFIQTCVNVGSFFVATAHDVTIELINFAQTPACNSRSQIEKFTQLQNVLLDENYLSHYKSYTLQLEQYKETSMNAINRERTEKVKNAPSWNTCLILAPKCFSYIFFDSNANGFYNNQQYVSAEKSANEFADSYSKYWKENSWIDWTSSIIFWVSIVFVAIWFTKWFYRFRNNENPGTPIGPIN